MKYQLSLFLGALPLAACNVGSAPEAGPAASRVHVSSFTGTIDTRAGTMTLESVVGRDLRGLGILNTDQDGTPGSGPANSLELVTTAVGLGHCGPNSFGGDVILNSFYTSSVTNLAVQITTLAPVVGNEPTNADTIPGLDNTLGLWGYAAPGNSRTWCFNNFGPGVFTFTGVVWGDVVGTNCGNGILDPGEEVDPPTSPFANISVNPLTCRWDLSAVPQLYCNGSCTWAGGSHCDQADADVFCRLRTDNPTSVATAFTLTTAQATHGFPCPGLGTTIPTNGRGSPINPVPYQDTSILANHGPGTVVPDTGLACSP